MSSLSFIKVIFQDKTYVAFFRWIAMKTEGYRGLLFWVGMLIIGFLAARVILVPSWPMWTGIQGKSAWDLADLLIVPLALAAIAYFFNRTERESEARIADDRIQEMALQNYFDKMTELLLKPNNLRVSRRDSEVRSIAQARTLSVLHSLNGARKGIVIKFLYESKLICATPPIVVLVEANLTKANLEGANLRGANLRGANLRGANLEGANLREANLEGANLREAILRGANLFQTILGGANLGGANLEKVYLEEANLVGVNLEEANMFRAHLGRANLEKAKLGRANLEKADVRGAYLKDIKLEMTNQKEASQEKINLFGANLKGKNLFFARPERTNPVSAKLKGARDDSNTTWPDGFDPVKVGVINRSEATLISTKIDVRPILDEDDRANGK